MKDRLTIRMMNSGVEFRRDVDQKELPGKVAALEDELEAARSDLHRKNSALLTAQISVLRALRLTAQHNHNASSRGDPPESWHMAGAASALCLALAELGPDTGDEFEVLGSGCKKLWTLHVDGRCLVKDGIINEPAWSALDDMWAQVCGKDSE
jgi:hypothetical protein